MGRSVSDFANVGVAGPGLRRIRWVTLLSRGGGLVDIAGSLAILAGYAAVLLTFASLRLRRSLVTP